MNEGRSWAAMTVVTWTSWAVVSGLLVLMWVALLTEHDDAAQAFGFSACAGSAVAATFHIRRFTCRTQALIRSLMVTDELRERELFEMGRDSVTELRPLR